MSFVTLNEILASREERALLQRSLLNMYSFPVVSFTMNIAGPVKNSPLIRRSFAEGLREIFKKIPSDSIVYKVREDKNTGCELVMSVNADARELKQMCMQIEDSHPLGRLFDIDVIPKDGNSITRTPVRGCIVCGAPGRECAASRLHSADEVMTVSRRIMTDFFFKKDAQVLSSVAHRSLVKEVRTTPKPGLVDCSNNGSHSDMNIEMFMKSAQSLVPYFEECFETGAKTAALRTNEVFASLKKAGINAEDAMYRATGGVNTHKGIIYSLGIICATVGRLWTPGSPFAPTEDILKVASELARHSDLPAQSRTIQLCAKYGIGSIITEAMSGFETVSKISLPVYSMLINQGCDENLAGACTLLHLIANADDTNLYHRGGSVGASWAKERAKELTDESPVPPIEKISLLDKQFIQRNLSPGGCADLLAITYFLFDLH